MLNINHTRTNCPRCNSNLDVQSAITAKDEEEVIGKQHISICFYCGMVFNVVIGTGNYIPFTEEDFKQLEKENKEAFKLVVSTSIAFETKWKIGKN